MLFEGGRRIPFPQPTKALKATALKLGAKIITQRTKLQCEPPLMHNRVEGHSHPAPIFPHTAGAFQEGPRRSKALSQSVGLSPMSEFH